MLWACVKCAVDLNSLLHIETYGIMAPPHWRQNFVARRYFVASVDETLGCRG